MNIRQSKRTKAIYLTLLALSATTMLTACGDDEKLVRNEQECMKVTGNSEQWCKENIAKAKANAEKQAPKFASKEACEEDFGVGNCGTSVTPQTNNAGQPQQQSSFMPFMMGYMIGGIGNNGGGYAQPAYSNSNGRPITSSSYAASRVSAARTSSGSYATSNRAASVSRGGFGSSGSRGSFGG